jgi:hypothetical protein
MCSELAYPGLVGPELFTELYFEMQAQDNSSRSKSTEPKAFNPINPYNQFNPVKLGEFLLPGMTQQKMIYAFNLDVDSVRLHLVDKDQSDKHVARMG